jgi:hypothetical protein
MEKRSIYFHGVDFGDNLGDGSEIGALLRPETHFEAQLLSLPEFREGLLWGRPRFGHPEGKVLYHVREVLDNIDHIALSPNDRERMRVVALAHDTFKFVEYRHPLPRQKNHHHAHLARLFMERFIDDQVVLNIIELHDEAYYVWRGLCLYQEDQSQCLQRLSDLRDIMGDNMQLYYYFFKCDTRTGDKNQASLKWFEQNVEGIQVVDW